MLEVLVAILILSFGMLAAAGLTAASLQYSKMTQFQAIGTQLAAEYGDRVRGNRTGFNANLYNRTAAFTGASASVAVPGCAASASCTAAEIAAIDIAQWTNNLRRQLPSGSAYVLRDSVNTWALDMWIMWIDPNLAFGSTSTLAVTGGNVCPPAAIAGLPSTVPAPRCMYYRVSQ